MGMEDYREAVRLIREHEDAADFEGPQTEALVALAEAKLGLRFPEPYRTFLLEFGCGDVEGEEVFGVIDEEFDESAEPDAVWYTRELRRRRGLPHHFIAIGALAGGETIVIDADEAGPVFGRVFLLSLEAAGSEGSAEELAPDFGGYFLSLVRSALQEDE